MLNEILVKRAVNEYNSPLYLYDYQIIKKNIFDLLGALPSGINLYYSMKANPLLGICQGINKELSSIEVSSIGELKVALKSGFLSENILFSGPGKRYEDLYEAIREKVKINVESIQEIRDIIKICKQDFQCAKIMIRINPKTTQNTSSIKMTGLASQFGIDFSEMEDVIKIIKTNRLLNLIGFSIYMGSQIFSAQTIVSNTREIFESCFALKKKYLLDIQELDVGGGFGVPYFNNTFLDLNLLQYEMKMLFQEYSKHIVNVKISFESGRYLLANSGVFVTKVLSVKKSKDRRYVICDGGFNNVLLTSFFTKEIRDNFPMKLVKNTLKRESNNIQEYYITGPLCSPSDVMGIRVELPNVEAGDYIIIKNVGAYGLTYSPIHFISHSVPAEVIVNGDKVCIARTRSDINDLIKGQKGISNDFFMV